MNFFGMPSTDSSSNVSVRLTKDSGAQSAQDFAHTKPERNEIHRAEFLS
jgi:hypothetical protein